MAVRLTPSRSRTITTLKLLKETSFTKEEEPSKLINSVTLRPFLEKIQENRATYALVDVKPDKQFLKEHAP
ncbi:hypothetical protein AMTR_s00052p00142970 [Amborella trichopoda]|uniref:Uncharacterized protein n=1 Tax=Amborella trichopoda TaxID=13333 RepID=U5D4Q1_AMBTC|nr:hypothetical protein AMTR_s00052p00142970 [Amborella trichopoda]